MIEYFTNPKDKLFSEKVNSLRYTQIYENLFTRDSKAIVHGKGEIHVQSDDSYFGVLCDGCKRDDRFVWKVRNGHGIGNSFLCEICLSKRRAP